MNCVLFPKGSAMRLDSGSPKIEHIKDVLKIGDGGEIFAGNIGGKIYICRINFGKDGSAIFSPLREVETPPPMKISVAVAFTRPQIAKRILFEAACAGISRIIFYPASKGEAAYAKSSLYSGASVLECMEKGAEQACAADIPEFSTCMSLEEACRELAIDSPDSIKIAPDLYEATADLGELSCKISPESHICAAMGGERGFSNPDRILLRQMGWTLVSMGRRVLRTDTAFITLCGVLRVLLKKR